MGGYTKSEPLGRQMQPPTLFRLIVPPPRVIIYLDTSLYPQFTSNVGSTIRLNLTSYWKNKIFVVNVVIKYHKKRGCLSIEKLYMKGLDILAGNVTIM